MRRWHVEFERLVPAAHQDLLEFLGFEDEEVASLREGFRAWQQGPLDAVLSFAAGC